VFPVFDAGVSEGEILKDKSEVDAFFIDYNVPQKRYKKIENDRY
jgi:hypothetical protein